MNREQRRRASKDELYDYHKRQLDTLIEKNRLEATKQACEIMTAIIASGLHTDFGFGAARINKVLDAARKHLDLVNDGVISIKDVYEWCNDYGIRL